MDELEPRKIAVIRGGGLGDFILIFPLLKALRKTYPNASIHIIGNPETAGLALEEKVADKIFSLGSAETIHLFQDSDFSCFNSPILEDLKTADLAISFQGHPGGILHTNLGKLAQNVIIVPPPTDGQIHASQQFLDSVFPGQFGLEDLEFQLKASENHRKAARLFLDENFSSAMPIIALHPGSGSKAKNWPAGRFSRLIGKLESRGLQVLLIEGEADLQAVESIEREIQRPIVKASRQPIFLIGAMLEFCQLLITNDSGIGHLGGITGIPVLSLFGPTNPAVWKPLGTNVKVLNFNEVCEEEVFQAAIEILGGAP